MLGVLELMRNKQRSASTRGLKDVLTQTDVLLEIFCWITAWRILPAWLASRGITLTDFIFYAIGAGLLLSVGGVANGSPSFNGPLALAGYAVTSCLTILLAGGFVFGVASALS